MSSNAEKREQVLWNMVSYLEGVVDAAITDKAAINRVGSALGCFYAQLDDLEEKAGSSEPRVECVPCSEVVSCDA